MHEKSSSVALNGSPTLPAVEFLSESSPLYVQEKTLERVVLPLSGLTSWMMVLVGALMGLHVLGINIQPLLTVGGVSGIIVGLSAQSVLGNLISGINLVGHLTTRICSTLACALLVLWLYFQIS